MEKQTFTNEIKGHFNLRKPKGEKPTAIFFVVKLNGKQYKYGTGVRVYPKQWDNGKARISNLQTKQDNKNNAIVNKRLTEVLTIFKDYKQYLCETDQQPAPSQLKSLIYKDMKKENTIRIINNAFDYYYRNRETKESSINVEFGKLKIFISYIKENNLTSDVAVFSQIGINNYKENLIKKGTSNSRVNQLCQTVVKLINDVLCVNTEYLGYNFQQVKYVKLQDKRDNTEKGAFPLNEGEIKKIESYTNLSEKETFYKVFFLLQCEFGWRVSDMYNFLNGEYTEKDNVFSIVTKKRGTDAYALKNKKVEDYIKEIERLKECLDVKDFTQFRRSYNKYIRIIAKKAGLDRVIKSKNAKGKEENKPIYEVISSHCARHTKVTTEIKRNTPVEHIMRMTGHKDREMIDYYTQLTADEKIKQFKEYYN